MRTHRPIGFYVHHHGSGHATRTRQLAAHYAGECPVHVLTSAPRYFAGWRGGRVHALPPDVDPERDPKEDHLHNRVFHYAPTAVRTIPERMATISRFIHEFRPRYMIVDLSVEVSQFCRLCGVPVVSVRLHGDRDDLAHREAWRNSAALLAPFPEAMESDTTPSWVKDKTIYLGAFSRYDQLAAATVEESPEEPIGTKTRREFGLTDQDKIVLVINGKGGGRHDPVYWSETARVNPGYQWWLLGEHEADRENLPANLRILGFQRDTWPYLQAADLVVGSGGSNVIFEVAAAAKPFCCIPEDRPFNEQLYKARSLEKLDMLHLEPQLPKPYAWEKVLAQTSTLDPRRWQQLRRNNDIARQLRRLELLTEMH